MGTVTIIWRNIEYASYAEMPAGVFTEPEKAQIFDARMAMLKQTKGNHTIYLNLFGDIINVTSSQK